MKRARAISVLVACLLATAASAHDADVLGVYFDQAGTTDRIVTTSPGESVPLYLVLHRPSEPSGVAGWEVRIDVAGPQVIPTSSWRLPGNAIDILAPPEFQVGLGSPMPWADTLVLASGVLFVPMPGDEVEIRVGPISEPSLVVDGYPVLSPVYVPADDVDRLIPMGPASGRDADLVAVINDDGAAATAGLRCSDSSISFDRVPYATTVVRQFTIERIGDLAATFEASVDTSVFVMRTADGPWSRRVSAELRLQRTLTVSVMAVAPAPGDLRGTISLECCGEESGLIALSGTVLGPVACGIEPQFIDFGTCRVGHTSSAASFTIHNDGDAPLAVSPVTSCPGFTVHFRVSVVDPGDSARGLLTWTPLEPGESVCAIRFGAADCYLACKGTATASPAECEVIPEILNFGNAPMDGPPTSRQTTIKNCGGTSISGLVPSDCGAFVITEGAGPFTLLPAQSRRLTIAFAPGEPGLSACNLRLGADLCSDVYLIGNGVDLPCATAPTSIVFPVTEVGGVSPWRSAMLTNNGSQLLTGFIPSSCGPFEVVQGAGEYRVSPGLNRNVTIAFAPTTAGDFTCLLDLGTDCAGIQLRGMAVRSPPRCYLRPASLDFGYVPPGEVALRSMVVRNTGGSTLNGVVPTACGPFQVVSGGGSFSLGPDQKRTIKVSFSSPDREVFSCSLDLGEELCAPVPCSAVTGVAPCALSNERLNFGQVPLGQSRLIQFTIANPGVEPLTGAIGPGCGDFDVLAPGPFTVPGGQSREVWVSFTPSTIGTSECELPLGSDFCGPVVCRGVGLGEDGAMSDLVGVFFDRAGASTCAPPLEEPTTAYLCLLNPSVEGGVGCWRCEVDCTEGLEVGAWQLEGEGAINLLGAPHFQVFLPEPLPSVPVVVLAAAQVRSRSGGEGQLFVRGLTFAAGDKLEYGVAVADGSYQPLSPASGSWDLPVAELADGCTGVGVLGGVPTARVVGAGAGSGAGILVGWRFDPGQGDACHVYRSVDGEGPERLTASPLSPADGGVEYLDPATGLPPAAELVYVFALYREGVEVGRSAEVGLTWSAASPLRLLLRPCRPNPFNPTTTLTLALPRAGHVRLAVHDLRGRLVRVLLDGPLPAGEHELTWDGRDEAGRAVPSGTYVACLRSDRGRASCKLTLAR